MEMMAISSNRPPVIEKDGCRIFITVHDEFYRRRKAEFKQEMKLNHPDMQGEREVICPETPFKSFLPYRAHKPCAPYVRREFTYKIKSSGRMFRKIREKYESWLKAEEKWYAQFGLTPPDWRRG